MAPGVWKRRPLLAWGRILVSHLRGVLHGGLDRSCAVLIGSVRVQECSTITKSQQKRRSAFACIEACREGMRKGLHVLNLCARPVFLTSLRLAQWGQTVEKATPCLCLTAFLEASNILLFLPTGGPESEWAAIRKVLHAAMLDRGTLKWTSGASVATIEWDVGLKLPRVVLFRLLQVLTTTRSACKS